MALKSKLCNILAYEPQGHRQQAVWEYEGDKGVDSYNAG